MINKNSETLRRGWTTGACAVAATKAVNEEKIKAYFQHLRLRRAAQAKAQAPAATEAEA